MAFANWTLSEAVDQTAFFEEEEEDQYEREDPETRTTFDVTFHQEQSLDWYVITILTSCFIVIVE